MKVLALCCVLIFSGTARAETAFVAGGSGRTGIEVVRILQEAGFDVRASTRDIDRAASRYPDVKTWVEVDAHDTTQLRDAIMGSDIVISALGHGDFVGSGAPQFVGYLGVRNLIDAAVAARSKHVILITSSTAGHARDIEHKDEPRFGYVLFWKTKAEDYLIESGVPYTIVGPGGLADEFLIELRAIEPPPPEGWGVKMTSRPDYTRDFVDRKGVANVVLRAIRNPDALGKAIAVTWDKSISAGETTGSYADIPAENSGKSYSTPR